ncbi:small multi-drug export protein [Candidatus Saccharibacteria bacterium]|nr:small multi-drug export protein [Candidatus Saccharibacteria bacterium]
MNIFLASIITLLVSMVPIIELRGAIPIGVGLGVPELLALIIAVIGNLIPVPFIYKFSRKFLEWGAGKTEKDKKPEEASKNTPSAEENEKSKPTRTTWKPLKKFCDFCLKKGEKAGKKLQKKTGDSIYFALFLFVGIPLPGTGVWTGTLAASLLDLDFKKTTIAIMCGVLLAGAIMLAISFGVFSVILK